MTYLTSSDLILSDQISIQLHQVCCDWLQPWQNEWCHVQ